MTHRVSFTFRLIPGSTHGSASVRSDVEKFFDVRSEYSVSRGRPVLTLWPVDPLQVTAYTLSYNKEKYGVEIEAVEVKAI